jgi:hypothetical protein
VVSEPTTTYGYNAWCLDPAFWWRTDADGEVMPRKRSVNLGRAGELFVFADAANFNTWTGNGVFQNSTSLDPPQFPWGPNGTATTHFRHHLHANALCADGHAEPFDREGGRMPTPEHQLGFVGDENAPHYDQP